MKQDATYKCLEWRDSDCDYIKDHYQTKSDKEIALHLGRTVLGVVGKRTKLRLFRYRYPKELLKQAIQERDNIVRIYNIVTEMNNIIQELEKEPNLFARGRLKVKLINLQNISIRV